MEIQSNHLKAIEEKITRERDDIRALQRKLNSRRGVIEASKEKSLQSLKAQGATVMKRRNGLRPQEFTHLLKYFAKQKESIKAKADSAKDIEKYTSQLGRQLEYFDQKLGVLQRVQSEKSLNEHAVRLEFESAQLEELALLQRESDSSVEREREPAIPMHEQDDQAFSPPDPCYYDSPGGYDSSQSTSQGESQEAPSTSTRSEGYWKDGENHHVQFTYKLNDETSVTVQIERRRERALSLVVLLDSDEKKAILPTLKGRLSLSLQQSGFSLENLRAVVVGGDESAGVPQ
ncbi:MAG: hypothetical protein KDD60_11815 [Bdellovibrionales bacterium]|nr:hypothetical protein [Bdellovibrionales bacterium]